MHKNYLNGIFFILVAISANANDSLKLSLTLANNVYNIGDSVKIDVTIKNYSTNAVKFPLLFIPQDHYIDFTVVNKDGDTLKFSGPEIKVQTDHFDVYRLQSDMKITKTLNLSKYFSFSKDRYYITAVYHIEPHVRSEKNAWYGNLYSETLIIDIP